MLTQLTEKASAGNHLTQSEMTTAIDLIMQGKAADKEIAALLTALYEKGETAEEVAGAAQAMRNHMKQIATNQEQFVDTCGTGGDGSGTFNISTAAAIVTAAAGLPVAKHGNRGITSKSGSADVLASLGLNIEASVEQVQNCLKEVGLCFCFAPLFHQSMKHVASARKSLPFPTIFNLLGPLSNPARAPYQLLGVGNPDKRMLMAEALSKIGIQKAVVVTGADGLDEVTLTGPSHVALIEGTKVTEEIWEPGHFGLKNGLLNDCKIDGPESSAEMIQAVLAGKHGSARDVVLLNAATALWLADTQQKKPACARQAAEAIDSGAAASLLEKLCQVSYA